MKGWLKSLAVAAVTAGMLVTAGLGLADQLLARAERVKREIARAAARQAALRGSKGELPKDDSLCLLCHANFREEVLVAAHLKQGITCAACHGLSYEHMNDETSRTKPDIMFGRAEVASFCQRCHQRHLYPDKVAASMAQWKGKTRPNGRLILPQAMCTDCHGTHVMVAATSARS